MSRRRVARLDDLPAGQPTLVETEGARVVLSRVNDDVFACSDECAHQGGPLSEGRLAGTRLDLPLARLDVRPQIRNVSHAVPGRSDRDLSRDDRGR